MSVDQREVGKVWRGAPGSVWWVLGFFNQRTWQPATSFHPDDLSAALSWGVVQRGQSDSITLTDLGKALRGYDGPKIEKPPN